MYIVFCYAAYLVISLCVTVWVARTLHRNGRTFLIDAFNGNQELADSVNHLLVVGFYLVNLGYVTLAMRTADPVLTVRSSIELVCDKLGIVLMVLGFMHFSNLYVFTRLRKREWPMPGRPCHPMPGLRFGPGCNAAHRQSFDHL